MTQTPTEAPPAPKKPRLPLLTGWCNPSAHPDLTDWGHRRCSGGSSANPDREWQRCPCACHVDPDAELAELLGFAPSVEDELADLL